LKVLAGDGRADDGENSLLSLTSLELER